MKLFKTDRFLALSLGAVLLFTSLVVPSASGSSETYLAQRASHRDCIAADNANCVPKGWLSRGTAVSMHCWADGRWAKGRYKSNRWFYVTGPDGVRGYVHSSSVENQTAVGHCDSRLGIPAATWAAERVGDDGTRGSSPYGEWSGWCAGFSIHAYEQVGGSPLTGLGSARAYFHEYDSRGLLQTNMDPTKIHIGSILLWRDVSMYGHAAIYVGNGHVVTTRGSEGDALPVGRVALGDYGGPVGWVSPKHVDGN